MWDRYSGKIKNWGLIPFIVQFLTGCFFFWSVAFYGDNIPASYRTFQTVDCVIFAVSNIYFLVFELLQM